MRVQDTTEQLVFSILRPREPESDKNTYGRVLAVCGCRDYIGAPYFAAMGAVRTGSGIVTLAVPECIYPILAGKLNEPTFLRLAYDENGRIAKGCLPELGRRAAILAGPGLGLGEGVTDTVCHIVAHAHCPVILDADGINALAGHIDVLERAEHPVVLTPHRAEFARICDESPELPPAEMAAAFAQRHRCVLLLKGHRTLIAAPDGRVYRNTTGNPGMAKGGSGDILSGVILSLLGQGIPPVEAAVCGAYLHGRAGDFAANEIGEYGMTPSDMLAYLPQVLKPLNSRVW